MTEKDREEYLWHLRLGFYEAVEGEAERRGYYPRLSATGVRKFIKGAWDGFEPTLEVEGEAPTSPYSYVELLRRPPLAEGGRQKIASLIDRLLGVLQEAYHSGRPKPRRALTEKEWADLEWWWNDKRGKQSFGEDIWGDLSPIFRR